MTLTIGYDRESFWDYIKEYTEDILIPSSWEDANRNIEKGLNAVLSSPNYVLYISEDDDWFRIQMENSDVEEGGLTVVFKSSDNYTKEKMTVRVVEKIIEEWALEKFNKGRDKY